MDWKNYTIPPLIPYSLRSSIYYAFPPDAMTENKRGKGRPPSLLPPFYSITYNTIHSILSNTTTILSIKSRDDDAGP